MFDVDVQEDLAPYLQEQITQDFGLLGNSDIKKLLQAYIRSNIELYEIKKSIEKESKRIDDIL